MGLNDTFAAQAGLSKFYQVESGAANLRTGNPGGNHYSADSTSLKIQILWKHDDIFKTTVFHLHQLVKSKQDLQ